MRVQDAKPMWCRAGGALLSHIALIGEILSAAEPKVRPSTSGESIANLSFGGHHPRLCYAGRRA